MAVSKLVIYHANCTDGFGAAWCFHDFWPGQCEFFPASHGSEPPDVKGREVYIVDFSYPRKTLIQMHADAESLVVLDHHVTAKDDLAGLDFCVFDMERSGAGMAWDYLYSADWQRRFGDDRPMLDTDRPWFINYVEDRDLWRWALPDSRAIAKYLSTVPHEFEVWDQLEHMDATDAVVYGLTVIKHENHLMDWALMGARRMTIGGYDVPVVNSPVLKSELGHRMCEGEPFAGIWSQGSDGRIHFSLRSHSKDDVNVGEIAKLYGGGGHHCAAGFTLNSLEELT